MSTPPNALITAAGRRTTLVRAFVEVVRARGGRTYAGDADPLAPALYLADDSVRLARIDDRDYLPELLDIVERHGIRLLIPTIDPDLPVLAQSQASFLSLGCIVAISSESFVAMAFDKHATAVTFAARDVAVPDSWLPAEALTDLPDKLFVKPRRGSASLGTYVVTRQDLAGVLPLVKDPIIQELLDGPEITIDALLDLEGRPIHFVPRRRIKTLGGESIEGVTLDHDPELEAWIINILDICGALGAAGPLCLQAFITKRGPVLSEINARFGGGFPLTLAAGGDHPAWLLDIVAGIKVAPRLGQYEPGLFMTRYYVEHFTRAPKW